MADIGSVQLVFPHFIHTTSERPDVVLYSVQTKTVILIENTSGCEENQPDNHIPKLSKYSDLVEAIEANSGLVTYLLSK